MGEPFRLRRPTKRETGGLLVAAAGAAWLAGQELKGPTATEPISRTGEGSSRHSGTQGVDKKVQRLENQTVGEHAEHRDKTSSDVLGALIKLDDRFQVTTTTAVNGVAVADQFFGIDYRLENGSYVTLGAVYPNEATGELQLNPDDSLNTWVLERTGNALNSLSVNDPDAIADAAAELLKLEDLKRKDTPSHPVPVDEITSQLYGNASMTTQEIQEQRERDQTTQDTGA